MQKIHFASGIQIEIVIRYLFIVHRHDLQFERTNDEPTNEYPNLTLLSSLFLFIVNYGL